MPPRHPDRAALASIDALHDADPAPLSAEVRRLRRFVRIRRVLYYSVLAPFGALSRWVHQLVVPVTAMIATVLAFFMALGGAPPVLVVALGYWGIGGLAYFWISMRMATLLDEAAAAAGLDAGAVLARWAGQQEPT